MVARLRDRSEVDGESNGRVDVGGGVVDVGVGGDIDQDREDGAGDRMLRTGVVGDGSGWIGDMVIDSKVDCRRDQIGVRSVKIDRDGDGVVAGVVGVEWAVGVG